MDGKDLNRQGGSVWRDRGFFSHCHPLVAPPAGENIENRSYWQNGEVVRGQKEKHRKIER